MKKGQYFTIEQMLLFVIGVMITIMIYFSLVAIDDNIKKMAEEDQMYEIGKMISSEMNRAYLSPKSIELTFDIPKKISEKGYKVYIENNGAEYNLTLKLEEKVVTIPLESKYNPSGMLFSSSGKIRVEKIGNQITIGRF